MLCSASSPLLFGTFSNKRRSRNVYSNMYKGLFATLIVCAVLLSACSRGVSPEALADPTYFWGQGTFPCGFTRAVDAEGALWDEHGCESGALKFRRIGRLDDQTLKQLEDAFAALPAPASVDECPSSPHSFRLRETDGSLQTWEVCTDDETFYETSDLPEPYQSIAEFFILE